VVFPFKMFREDNYYGKFQALTVESIMTNNRCACVFIIHLQ
jgi:hypothetical protein